MFGYHLSVAGNFCLQRRVGDQSSRPSYKRARAWILLVLRLAPQSRSQAYSRLSSDPGCLSGFAPRKTGDKAAGTLKNTVWETWSITQHPDLFSKSSLSRSYNLSLSSCQNVKLCYSTWFRCGNCPPTTPPTPPPPTGSRRQSSFHGSLNVLMTNNTKEQVSEKCLWICWTIWTTKWMCIFNLIQTQRREVLIWVVTDWLSIIQATEYNTFVKLYFCITVLSQKWTCRESADRD